MIEQKKFKARDQFNLYRKQLMGEQRPLPDRYSIQDQDQDLAGSQDDRFNDDWQQFGQLVQSLDPATLPVYYFYVNVSGQILYGQFQNYDRVKCKYAFVSGVDWYTAKGIESGQSGYARKRYDNKCIWDLDFEVKFRSTYPYGWPQLVMQFQGSSLGKSGIISYACGHVPTQTQLQQKKFRVFQPMLSKKDENKNDRNQEAWFDAKVIASAQGREVTSVQAKGTVTVLFQVTTRNMEPFGYKID